MSIKSYIEKKFEDIVDVGATRMTVCKACAFYQPPVDDHTFKYSLCTSCGCVLEVKVLIMLSGCPTGKWPV